MKFLKRYPIIFPLFYLTWGVLLWKAYNLFTEINDFSTEGAALIIRMLEFTNFRSKELVTYFILYFILISLNILYLQVLGYNKKNQAKSIFIGINIVLILLSIYLSNIFWSVSLVLIFLSGIIIWSAQTIYKLFLDHSIIYDDGDIIYSSDEFNDTEEAEKELRKFSKNLKNPEIVDNIFCDIYEENNKFYFYIQAKDTIKVNKKELL